MLIQSSIIKIPTALFFPLRHPTEENDINLFFLFFLLIELLQQNVAKSNLRIQMAVNDC